MPLLHATIVPPPVPTKTLVSTKLSYKLITRFSDDAEDYDLT